MKPAHGIFGARPRGMTIIELMVALIVLGILVSLVIAPAVSGMAGRHRVQGVHAELLGDLQLARSDPALRNGTNTSVSVAFGSNANITCYTIHTVSGATPCDCTRAPGDACTPVVGAREIKTLQFARAAGVSVAASSPTGSRITFAPPQGLATPDNLVIDVQDATRGQLRTSISGLGVPSVCSPDGSIPGVPTC
jgi:prepilin-type N-terminal cleavage/methylation domain-containing protein